MIYESNLSSIIDKLNVKLKGLKNTDPMLRDIAVSLATNNVSRIHNEGKNLAGNKIGTYKESTMKVRRQSKKINPANRTRSTDIILSFTRTLSTEFQASAISGGWGAGFISPYGGNLFKILTKKFGNIWGISESDKRVIKIIINKNIDKKIGSITK